MSDEDHESVETNNFECVNGIFIVESDSDQELKSNKEELKQTEEKGKFSENCLIFHITTE